MKANPNHVTKTDQTIVKWQDVPEKYQKKILDGTMTDEDWSADWDTPENFREKVGQLIEESINVRTSHWTTAHVHTFRKEYDTCMIKGCGVVNGQRRE